LAVDRRRVITVRSFSKRYSMTGYRIGYVAAEQKIIQALLTLQSHSTGNVCTFAQYGALAALDMDQDIVRQRKEALQRRRDLAYDYTSSLFNCINAEGAFYLFPEVYHYLRRNETSEDLAMLLLDKAGVAVVPGDAFHGPGHIRISFAASEEDLHQAFERIKTVL
jgi:aspartate aminotransferase